MVKGNTKKQMGLILALTFLTNFFMAMGYIVNGTGINGAVSCILGCVISVINFYFRINSKPIPKFMLILYFAGFLIINILSGKVFILTVIAILATFAFVIGLAKKDGKGFRIWKIINNLLWGVYDIVSKSFNSLLLHTAIILFTLLGSLIFDVKKDSK